MGRAAVTPQGDRLKVLHLIDSLQGGGAERSLAEMLPGLSELGIDPIVACVRRSTDGVEDQVAGIFDLRYLTARRFPGRVRQIREINRTERPGLVHTTLLHSDLLGRLAARRTAVPVLTSLVNTSYDPVRLSDPRLNAKAFRLVRLVDGFTARRYTTHFHAITRAVKDHNVSALGISPTRVTVIERGRDARRLGARTADRRAEARRSLGLTDDHEVIATLGRQEYQKGQRFLLEAVERLASRRPDVVLVLMGRRGAASAELDDLLARPALAGRVRMLGHREGVPDVLAGADVFAFPSLFEGLGGSLIEAMALGLPIVASDLPATREVLEPGANATLVAPGLSEPLAGAIEELLVDRDRAASFGRRSRELFEERFTLDASVERMAGLYRMLTNREETRPNGVAAGGTRSIQKGSHR